MVYVFEVFFGGEWWVLKGEDVVLGGEGRGCCAV